MMRAERLKEIEDRTESFDVGDYYGVDMLADAITELRSDIRELLDEVDRAGRVELGLRVLHVATGDYCESCGYTWPCPSIDLLGAE